MRPANLVGVKSVDDVGVVQRRRRPDLTLETTDGIRVIQQRLARVFDVPSDAPGR